MRLTNERHTVLALPLTAGEPAGRTAFHCVNQETGRLDRLSRFTSFWAVQAFLTCTQHWQKPQTGKHIWVELLWLKQDRSSGPCLFTTLFPLLLTDMLEKGKNNSDQLTCIFQILVSSSKDNLLPKSSIIPFIRSQYWAWSMLPKKRDTQQADRYSEHLTF